MLSATEALLRCKALIPHLELEIERITSDKVVIRHLEMEKWAPVYIEIFNCLDVVEEDINEFPDIHPFNGISQLIEDIEALVQSLFIFYDCTLKDRSEFSSND